MQLVRVGQRSSSSGNDRHRAITDVSRTEQEQGGDSTVTTACSNTTARRHGDVHLQGVCALGGDARSMRATVSLTQCTVVASSASIQPSVASQCASIFSALACISIRLDTESAGPLPAPPHDVLHSRFLTSHKNEELNMRLNYNVSCI